MPWYPIVLRPALFAMDAERAHDFTMGCLRLASRSRFLCERIRCHHAFGDARLAQTLWGRRFAHPVGLAAGLDKNAEAIPALAAMGFSQVEVGTVTGVGQPGNPQPRLFRLKADHGIINRMGFNNHGCQRVAMNLARQFDRFGGRRRPATVLGINLGKSKMVELDQAATDYEASIAALGPLADYLVINVSSPNTPGLRDLQGESALRPLLQRVRAAVDHHAPNAPLLLKIAPDLAEAGIDAVVDVALESRLDGLIATNTTISRDGLTTPAPRIQACGAGGLSGRPLLDRSTAVLARVARRLRAANSPVPVIGVGGIDSAEAAWRKIGAGADLVQLYSALIYHGPGIIETINRGLVERLERHGLKSIGEAVGRDL